MDNGQKNEEIEDLHRNIFSSSVVAKEWGCYLIEVGKKVSKTAVREVRNIHQNLVEMGIVEEVNIIGKFSEEQAKFTEEKKLLQRKRFETSLPWVDALCDAEGERQTLRTKILSVSFDERNFLRNPPSGSGFVFDYEMNAPVAQLLLGEDEGLAAMRFNLVPKRIKEEVFWRNYFYRVFLIKQSLQSDSDRKDEVVHEDPGGTGTSIVPDNVNHSRLDAIGVCVKVGKEVVGLERGEDNDDWEAELQKELSEFELVDPGLVIEDDGVDFDDLEREILDELEK